MGRNKMFVPKIRILFFVLFIFFICCEDKPVNNFPPRNVAVLKQTVIDSTEYYKKYYEDYSQKIDAYFSKQHNRTQFYGNVLFAEKGRVIFEKSYGYKKKKSDPDVDLSNTFQLASVTKVFTAISILILYERGKLDLQDSVKKYIPSFPYNYNITIHQLLSHTSGLGKYTHFCDNPASVWEDKDCSIYNENVMDIIREIIPPLVKTPGKRFYYTNTNFIILASIIEKISGMKYHDFVAKNIFEPLDMTSSKVYYRDNEGELINPVVGYEANLKPALDIYLNACEGDKGIYSNVNDLLKFDQALYQNILIKQETLNLAMTGYSSPAKWKSDMNYGYGFRMINLPKTDEKIVYHTGWWRGFRSYFIRRIDKEQTVIILSNVKRGPFFKIADLVEFLP